MGLRERNGKWNWRFMLDGQKYSGATDLDATKRNETKALQVEQEYRQALLEGRRPSRRIQVRRFNDAAVEFLEWAKTECREHPNSAKRLKSSFASLTEFFGDVPVSLIDDGQIDKFKERRRAEHKVRDITLRHDLHALSKFFGYAIKQHWTRGNPVCTVTIPSDSDAIREHILTDKEEKTYFERAAKHPDLHDLGRLMINQGGRPEEIVSAAKTDVDFEAGTLKIPKGKSKAARRTLDLTAESKSIIAQRMNGNSPWLFPSKRNPGKHITRLNSAHDRLLAEATKDKIEFNFVIYDFRHTFATRFVEVTPDLTALAAIMGHGSIRLVQRTSIPRKSTRRLLCTGTTSPCRRPRKSGSGV